MTKEEIIKAMSQQLDKEEIKENDMFKEDYHMDSIDLVSMLMDVEDEYNIEIADEDALKIKTVGDFVDIILEEVK